MIKVMNIIPSAVLTVPPLLFNFVAFQTLSISAGAIDEANPPAKALSLFESINPMAGLGVVGFIDDGCEYSVSSFILKSSAPFCGNALRKEFMLTHYPFMKPK